MKAGVLALPMSSTNSYKALFTTHCHCATVQVKSRINSHNQNKDTSISSLLTKLKTSPNSIQLSHSKFKQSELLTTWSYQQLDEPYCCRQHKRMHELMGHRGYPPRTPNIDPCHTSAYCNTPEQHRSINNTALITHLSSMLYIINSFIFIYLTLYHIWNEANL